ncbi:RNA polymerase sigma factor [Streptomyces galilaeus]|uniref:RNA polymerase sigma factor n=1 Tax=Streptomyces galilaeus TaxID=33899 RepID=A0ABW9IVR6_STRGJ
MNDLLEALVARAVAGGDDGADAIAALYDELNETVYRWVRFYIRDGHVAEDLCQEVWLTSIFLEGPPTESVDPFAVRS